jgi:hypothetical protein
VSPVVARRVLLASLALPIVALALMVGRGELVSRTGRPYRIHIVGYDPRDMVRGHYLNYTLRFKLDDPPERCTTVTCLYCLRGPPGSEPWVTRVSPGDTAGCDATFADAELERLQQFFVPEDRAAPLEIAIRAYHAELSVRISAGGTVVIQDLLLDGKPWREVVR